MINVQVLIAIIDRCLLPRKTPAALCPSQLIRNAAWTVAVGFQLQKNEVIMIDNERLSHAR